MSPGVINLNDVIQNMQGILHRTMGEDIQIEVYLGQRLASVHADPSQMEQILMNLAANARDAMPQGGRLTIQTENIHSADASKKLGPQIKPGPYVALVVTDNRSGIPGKIKTKIFDPYIATKEKNKGTGLGLATVYGIVNQSGGHIWAQSAVGEGTTFQIYLPAVHAKKTPRKPGPQAAGTGPRGGKETILLVEDEAEVRKVAKRILEKFGYSILEAENGEAALKVFQNSKKRIDMVLTDTLMPKMNGRILGQKLLKIDPRTKILYMSGNFDASIALPDLNPSVSLQKPFSQEFLLQKIRETLDG